MLLSTLTFADLHFLAVGDWGGLPVPPWVTPAQQSVASAMGTIAERHGSSFVLSLGDHFYFHGVRNADDPRWRRTFERVYQHEALSGAGTCTYPYMPARAYTCTYRHVYICIPARGALRRRLLVCCRWQPRPRWHRTGSIGLRRASRVKVVLPRLAIQVARGAPRRERHDCRHSDARLGATLRPAQAQSVRTARDNVCNICDICDVYNVYIYICNTCVLTLLTYLLT